MLSPFFSVLLDVIVNQQLVGLGALCLTVAYPDGIIALCNSKA